MAIKLADTARPNNYVDAEHLGTFPVAYAEDVWFADGTRLSEKTFDGQSIQVEELPVASATEEGHVYQYLGETGTYKHGYFYECIEDNGTYAWEEKTISTDYPIKEVDTLPTGDNIENYIYSKRDSEYSLDIAGLSKTEIENTLIANGFTIATTPHSYSYEFLITYPTPIDVWHPTEKKWLTPKDYDYISFNKTNPPELAIVRTNAAGQKVTMYIGTYGDYTVFKYSDPTSYYIGDSSRKSTEQLVLHREIGSLTNCVEYTSTIPIFDNYATEDGVVIVFSGEDTNGFLQGHHYRWSEYFPAVIKECRIRTNAEGSYLMTYIKQDEELKVGTHLYSRNGTSYWCQTIVSAIGNDYITLYDVNSKQSTTYTYGYTIIEDSPSTVTISYDWVDIGGGGDGGGSEEFIGTKDEWDALSQSQKDKYDGKIVNITDNGADGISTDTTPTKNSNNLITSGGIYDAIAYRNNSTVACTLRRMKTDGSGVEETGTTKACLVIPLVGSDNLALIIGSGEVPINNTEVQQKFGFILSGVQANGVVNYGVVNIGITEVPSSHLSYSAGFLDFWIDAIPTPPPSGARCIARFICVAKLQ